MNSSLTLLPFLLSMCGDGIISRPIWAVGKLIRVQSSRDGGANVFLKKSLKKLHDC